MIILKNILTFILFFLSWLLAWNIASLCLCSYYKKKYPLLYVYGFDKGVVYLGRYLDNNIGSFGVVPVIYAEIDKSDVIIDVWVSYCLKPCLHPFGKAPYKVKFLKSKEGSA